MVRSGTSLEAAQLPEMGNKISNADQAQMAKYYYNALFTKFGVHKAYNTTTIIEVRRYLINKMDDDDVPTWLSAKTADVIVQGFFTAPDVPKPTFMRMLKLHLASMFSVDALKGMGAIHSDQLAFEQKYAETRGLTFRDTCMPPPKAL